MTTLEMAEFIARRAHDGQADKQGLPYIHHPARMAADVGDDPDAAAVAWLHDVIEDTPVTASFLREQGMPAHIVEAVEIVTRRKDAETYRQFIERIAASRNALAIRVKLADLGDNMARPGAPGDIVDKRYRPAFARLTAAREAL